MCTLHHPPQPPTNPPRQQHSSPHQPRQEAVGRQLGKCYHIFNRHNFSALQCISSADEPLGEAAGSFFHPDYPMHKEAVFPAVEDHMADLDLQGIHGSQQNGVAFVHKSGAHAVPPDRQTHRLARSDLFFKELKHIFVGQEFITICHIYFMRCSFLHPRQKFFGKSALLPMAWANIPAGKPGSL